MPVPAPPAAKPTLKMTKLAGHPEVVAVAVFLKQARERGHAAVEIDLTGVEGGTYANAIVPLAALVEQHKELGLQVTVKVATDSFLNHARVRSPLLATRENLSAATNRLSLVWAYTEDLAVHLCNSLVEDFSRQVQFSPGVLQTLNWSLYEVLDNVFQHSHVEQGFVMASVTKQRPRLSVCVADTGIGIHRSFIRGGVHRPRTGVDAITLALQEGVSSTGDKRGNGLYGLKAAVEENRGSLRLISGRSGLEMTDKRVTTLNLGSGIIADDDHFGTVVDWQVRTDQAVDISKVLAGRAVHSRLESFESDEGFHIIKLAEHAHGTGSRKAATELRNWLVNVLNEGAPVLYLDFEGVNVVSSSFADETIGKLAETFGPIEFARRIRLVHMSETIERLLDRAISIRLANLYAAPQAQKR